MKRLVLFVWVLMQVIIPTLISEEYFATAIQLELAFFAFALWYFNKLFNRNQLEAILRTFAFYYGYIYLTDQLITELPYYLVYAEALIIYSILHVQLGKLTK